MRELTPRECNKYVDSYSQKLMSDPEFLQIYRAKAVPECYELLAEKIQEELTKDYNNGKLPCEIYAMVGTGIDHRFRITYHTDCDVICDKAELQPPDKEELEDEEVKTSLSDYSDEELLLELLCRAHRR